MLDFSKKIKTKIKMKFAHIADCHLGVWREPRLQKLNILAFEKAIDECIKEKVGFVIITGDLFDTAMPSVDILKVAAAKLKELQDCNIDCYIIPGSHDYSASGKTFLDVFENAGLFKNVARFNETEKGIELELFKKGNLLITGLPGKRIGLEKELVKKIIKKEKEMQGSYFKILALHTSVTEATKPKELEFLEPISSSELPDDFNYYALGHLHRSFQKNINGKFVAYPGPLFPTNFAEFEELKTGSFYIINVENNNQIRAEKKEIKLKQVANLIVNADNKSPEQITEEAQNKLKSIRSSIVTLRFQGELARGKTADISFAEIASQAEKNYNILLKNTSALTSREFKIEVESKGKSIEEIEKEVIERYEQKKEHKEFAPFIKELIKALDVEKQEGETNTAFEKRVADEASKVLCVKLE